MEVFRFVSVRFCLEYVPELGAGPTVVSHTKTVTYCLLHKYCKSLAHTSSAAATRLYDEHCFLAPAQNFANAFVSVEIKHSSLASVRISYFLC